MRVLGIESSCDETAVAIVDEASGVLSSVVSSQIAQHQPFGGVVPELAAREHVQAFPHVLEAAIREAKIEWSSIDAIACTRGPGLSSSLLSGMSVAQGLAQRLGCPLLPVHHLEAHLLSLYFAENRPDEPCPALVLLVTGGHTALIRMQSPGRYELLGRSIDDAAGEALDKGARLLGLSYPGGPEIERLASSSSSSTKNLFPKGLPSGERALTSGGDYAFSFSGLKTSLRYYLQKNPDAYFPDVAKAYQSAVMNTLSERVSQALDSFPDWFSVACVGGVAKNEVLKTSLKTICLKKNLKFITVPTMYCTDNAAMIAAVPLLRTVQSENSGFGIDPNWDMQGLSLRP